jgi:hypothetical protein
VKATLTVLFVAVPVVFLIDVWIWTGRVIKYKKANNVTSCGSG